MTQKRENRLRLGIRFSLFATSYTPLFILLIINQVSQSLNYLSWGGINKQALVIFWKYFGLTSISLFLILLGIIGVYIFIIRVSEATIHNGTKAKILDVKNKNSEAISYIGTYIIPFLFQEYSSFSQVLSIVVLFVVIYFIYVNSSLILINPTLNLFYSLYEVEFVDSFSKSDAKKKSGMVITKEKYLEDDDIVLMKSIGHKLFFAINRGKN